ncbi:manganese transporter [Fulvivirga sp. M361]|uniref:metal ABC transporter solute-binding protein, Zn/Mn family n=1 Tax=Fulvivirga sp. M361 TaxID=2594266 RepID=UPI00117ADBD6|nr:zinc ABC transporter substrate-binding protein [Fulvivirga sp. M361]TRX50680.1 manganese transporter [Fulvivirga sp. M361]
MDCRLIFALLAAALFTGCSSSKTEDKTGRLNIVVTTGMIEDAVKNVVGDSVQVTALMGPGVDPHLYKATQGDLKKLTQADLIFYNGLHLEGKMGEVLEKLGRVKPVIAVAEGIDNSLLRIVPEFNDSADPHIWFDVSLWKEAVKTILSGITELDGKNNGYYNANAENYLVQLDSLHRWVKSQILTIPEQQRTLITAHDAFGYFGEAYHIDVRGLQGISTLSEYGLRDVSDLVNYITKNKIKAVFVETSVSEKAINAVVQGCRDKGFEVQIGGNLYSDAMGESNTPEGTYLGMVRTNVNTIVNALK